MNFSRSTSGCCVTIVTPQGRSSAAIRVMTMAKETARTHVALDRFDAAIPGVIAHANHAEVDREAVER